MADASARFAIALDSSGVVGSAKSAAAAMESAKKSIFGYENELKELNAVQRRLKASGKDYAKNDLFKSNLDRIAVLKSKIAGSTEQFVKMGGTFGKTTQGAEDAAGGIQGFLGKLAEGGGPVGGFASKIQGLITKFGKAGLVGVAIAAAVAIVMVGIAIAKAAYQLTLFAIQSANAARAHGLLLQAATGSEAAAGKVEATVSRLRGTVALSDGKLREMATSMARAGLAGKALDSTLGAVSMTTATMGDAAGSKIQGIIEANKRMNRLAANRFSFEGTGLKFDDVAGQLAKSMNVSIATARASLQQGRVQLAAGAEAIRKAVEAKFGKIAQAQLLDFTFQTERLKENMGKLFSGVKIEPFLKAFKSIADLFDESTQSGRALKAIAEGLLQPVIDAATWAAPILKGMFKGAVVFALILAIAILKIRNVLRDTFGGDTGIDKAKVAFYGMITVLTLLTVAAVGFTVAFFGPMIVGFLFLAAIIGVLALAIYGAYKIFQLLWKGAVKAYDYITELDWAGIGTNIIDGLVNGIKSGSGKVVDTIKGLGASMLDAFDLSFLIRSPSRAMHWRGLMIDKGAEGGIDAGAANVQGAMRDMISVPKGAATDAEQAGAQAARAVGRGGGGVTMNVTINGVSNAEQLTEPSFLDRLSDAIRDVAVSSGAMTVEVPLA